MMQGDVTVAMEQGAALLPLLPELARLRLTVFRDWPYLYDGSQEYETTYLQTYVKAPGAGIAVARDGAAVVGASTCLPLPEAHDEVKAPFVVAGLELGDFFYFGESVLLDAYRGRGIGVRFFELREARARWLGRARYCAFCAVERAAEDPRRPAGASGLDAFWRHRGYARQPDLTCRMAWKDVGAAGEDAKTLTFWIKPLYADAPL